MSSIIPASDLPADLFTTNRAPDDGELALARTLIRNLESQLYSPTVETGDPEGTGVDTKQSILDNLASLEKIIAPIRRVPADVLQEIFLTCIAPAPYEFRDDVPRTLSHISSGLRKIALSTPALWVTLNVKIAFFSLPQDSYIEEKTLRRRASWLKEVINRRSGNLPLRIYFKDSKEWYGSRQPRNASQEVYKEIVNLVLSCHSRWRDIQFFFRHSGFAQVFAFFQSLTPLDVPELNSITFGTDLARLQEMNFPLHLTFLACPSLKKIRDITLVSFCDHRPYLPLSTITELNCSQRGSSRPLSFADFANTLRLCVSLVSLTIHINTDVIEEMKPTEQGICLVYLPCLQHLAISAYLMAPFITLINAPHLQTLDLNLNLLGSYCPTEEIVKFFERSTKIQVLKLGRWIHAEMVLAILYRCPQLITLRLPCEINDSKWDKILLRFVDADTDVGILCPKLQDLDMDSDDGIRVADVNILKMLVTRKLKPSRLLSPWKKLKIRLERFGAQWEESSELMKLSDSCGRIIIRRAVW